MKAAFYSEYGVPSEVIQITNVDKPLPKEDEILIKVKASSINSWDWDRLTGRPKAYQLIHGIGKPKINIIGCDLAGVVEQVGTNITQFKVGDEVMGDTSGNGWGCFAEYACAREDEIIFKPGELDYLEAAALPQAGVLALQGLDQCQLDSGRILLNGAGGGVGAISVLIAKSRGLHVTCVDNAHKMEFLKSLGADEVVDYQNEDIFEKFKNNKFDAIVGIIAYNKLRNWNSILANPGIFVIVGGSVKLLLKTATYGALISSKKGRQYGILAHKPNPLDLQKLTNYFREPGFKVPVDSVFNLDEISDAFAYFGQGTFKGKVVVRVQ